MLDIDLNHAFQLVELAARFESPWDAEQVSAELVRSDWEPAGSVSLPHPKRLARDGLRLGITDYEGLVVLSVTLQEWKVDWNSPDYVSDVMEGYPEKVRDCRELAGLLASLLGEKFAVEKEELVLDTDYFAFVWVGCWKVSDVHVILGLEHLDPDDTPITVSLYLCRESRA
ncbi:hypothetical protein [Streptomyces sp. NPDC001530]|uniref:hypothetical protein n=1 Tax=Streptomyces sp. NPDC001530 TaxID=3364582 RepID=UPI00369CBB6B